MADLSRIVSLIQIHQFTCHNEKFSNHVSAVEDQLAIAFKEEFSSKSVDRSLDSYSERMNKAVLPSVLAAAVESKSLSESGKSEFMKEILKSLTNPPKPLSTEEVQELAEIVSSFDHQEDGGEQVVELAPTWSLAQLEEKVTLYAGLNLKDKLEAAQKALDEKKAAVQEAESMRREAVNRLKEKLKEDGVNISKGGFRKVAGP